MELTINSIDLPVITSAIEMIRKEALDRIYCSLTGVQIATLNDDEIIACLRQELTRQPLISTNELVDQYLIRHAILSSGPAPSLRLHRDRHVMVRVLQSDPNGPNKLFAYLAGRLFFESIVSERMSDTFDNRRARLAFLIELQKSLSALPSDWNDSLKPEDEIDPIADSAVSVLAQFNPEPAFVREAKAAQMCLESLVRLDAIFNLRNRFYNRTLLDRVLAFRDSHEFSFSMFSKLLNEIESDAVIRTSAKSLTPEGNAMVISAAIAVIGKQAKRVARFADLPTRVEEIAKRGRLSKTSTSGQIVQSIRELLEAAELKDKVTKRERVDLERLLRQLQMDTSQIHYTDKRLDTMRRVNDRISRDSGTVQVTRSTKALKSLAQMYKDSGKAMPAGLQKQVDNAINEGKMKKLKKSEMNRSAFEDAFAAISVNFKV